MIMIRDITTEANIAGGLFHVEVDTAHQAGEAHLRFNYDMVLLLLMMMRMILMMLEV